MGKEPYKLSTLLTDLIQREDVKIFIDTCSMMKESFDSFLGAGGFFRGCPCTRLTKYRETAEHEEGQVTDPMHLSTQSLNL